MTLAKALDGTIGLAILESADGISLSNKVVDNEIMFSVPLLCNSLLLLNSRSESVPLSKSDSGFVAWLLELMFLTLNKESALNQALVSLGVAPDFSVEHTDGWPASSCCFNLSSSSLTCWQKGKG